VHDREHTMLDMQLQECGDTILIDNELLVQQSRAASDSVHPQTSPDYKPFTLSGETSPS
jgi:hypothetical protein